VSEAGGAERRRSRRLEVRLVVEGCPGLRGGVDWATDLSLEGMRLERRLPVWAGTELELVVRLGPQPDAVRLRCVVLPGRPSGTGIRFVAPASRELERIAAFLASTGERVRDTA
jgi:hypothetical protein